ncbi:MAG: asparagine synthase (glutamine-hydrolyzing) [Euryarchaeota archaeon]|jgi:asparagine synthase (glutamine-hydrolysing)|nr:asparagine synthase (glutamine-hydrolyzing) [Euryarchaeota archaeon]
MCGITAVLGVGDLSLSRAMADILAHRGPDGIQVWGDENCSLGHSRLSIVDLAGSDQPIGSEHGCWLVQNGEIYNYRRLRRDYSGYEWKTKGDGEVILAAHHFSNNGASSSGISNSTTSNDNGSFAIRSTLVGNLRRTANADATNNPANAHVEWVSKLDGIFGFALWDSKRQELVLARDPLGVKPLLRTITPSGELLVASEAKAFCAHPEYTPRIDENAMLARLAFEYPLDETTLFEGVSQVAPATIETWSLDSEGRATLTGVATYSAEKVMPSSSWQPEVDAAPLLDSLCESIQDRLMSDVPLGIILSGGLDSSMVAGLAHKAAAQAGQPVPECWTVAEDEDNPDFRAAEEVCAALDLGHHTSTLEEDCFWRTLPSLGWHGEDLDISVLFFQPLFKKMASSVTVGLCGQGADELHGGYPRYRNLVGHQELISSRLLASRHPFADHLVKDISAVESQGAAQPWRASKHNPAEVYSDVTSTLQFEMDHGQLSNFQLRLVDRHSMAHGLEVRVPFLGSAHRKSSHTIPVDWRIRGKQEKLALRAAAALTDLPSSIVNRPKLPAGTATSPTLLNELLTELRPHANEWAERYSGLQRILKTQPDMSIGLRLFESLHITDGGVGREKKGLWDLLEDVD